MGLLAADTVLPTKIRLPVHGNPQGLKAQIFLREKLTGNKFNIELGVAACFWLSFLQRNGCGIEAHIYNMQKMQREPRGM